MMPGYYTGNYDSGSTSGTQQRCAVTGTDSDTGYADGGGSKWCLPKVVTSGAGAGYAPTTGGVGISSGAEISSGAGSSGGGGVLARQANMGTDTAKMAFNIVQALLAAKKSKGGAQNKGTAPPQGLKPQGPRGDLLDFSLERRFSPPHQQHNSPPRQHRYSPDHPNSPPRQQRYSPHRSASPFRGRRYSPYRSISPRVERRLSPLQESRYSPRRSISPHRKRRFSTDRSSSSYHEHRRSSRERRRSHERRSSHERRRSRERRSSPSRRRPYSPPRVRVRTAFERLSHPHLNQYRTRGNRTARVVGKARESTEEGMAEVDFGNIPELEDFNLSKLLVVRKGKSHEVKGSSQLERLLGIGPKTEVEVVLKSTSIHPGRHMLLKCCLPFLAGGIWIPVEDGYRVRWEEDKKSSIRTEGVKDQEKEIELESKEYSLLPYHLLECHICKVNSSCTKNFFAHIRGKKHKFILQAYYEKISAILNLQRAESMVAARQKMKIGNITVDAHCNLCRIDLSVDVLPSHYKSLEHKLLKNYQHVKCCGSIFKNRISFENHRLRLSHIKKEWEKQQASAENKEKVPWVMESDENKVFGDLVSKLQNISRIYKTPTTTDTLASYEATAPQGVDFLYKKVAYACKACPNAHLGSEAMAWEHFHSFEHHNNVVLYVKKLAIKKEKEDGSKRTKARKQEENKIKEEKKVENKSMEEEKEMKDGGDKKMKRQVMEEEEKPKKRQRLEKREQEVKQEEKGEKEIVEEGKKNGERKKIVMEVVGGKKKQEKEVGKDKFEEQSREKKGIIESKEEKKSYSRRMWENEKQKQGMEEDEGEEDEDDEEEEDRSEDEEEFNMEDLENMQTIDEALDENEGEAGDEEEKEDEEHDGDEEEKEDEEHEGDVEEKEDEEHEGDEEEKEDEEQEGDEEEKEDEEQEGDGEEKEDEEGCDETKTNEKDQNEGKLHLEEVGDTLEEEIRDTLEEIGDTLEDEIGNTLEEVGDTVEEMEDTVEEMGDTCEEEEYVEEVW